MLNASNSVRFVQPVQAARLVERDGARVVGPEIEEAADSGSG